MIPAIALIYLEAPAEPTVTDLAARLNDLDERLHYFVSFFEAAGVWVGSIVGLVGIITAFVVGIATFYGVNELRKFRRDLRNKTTELERNRISLETLQKIMADNYQALDRKIEARVIFYKDFLLGKLCYDNSDFGGALIYLERASKEDESTPEARYYLARALIYGDKINTAISTVEQLLRDDPANALYIRAMGLAKRFKDPTVAIQHFKTALDNVGTDKALRAEILNEIGLTHRDMKQFKEAWNYHESASEFAAHDPRTEYFLGTAKALCGHLEEGKGLIRSAATAMGYATETRRIKEIWGVTMNWSLCAITNDHRRAVEIWKSFAPTVRSSNYLRQTVFSHVECLCEAYGIDVKVVTDE